VEPAGLQDHMTQHAKKRYIIDPDKAETKNEFFVVQYEDLAFHFINIRFHKKGFEGLNFSLANGFYGYGSLNSNPRKEECNRSLPVFLFFIEFAALFLKNLAKILLQPCKTRDMHSTQKYVYIARIKCVMSKALSPKK
jgi:hypothetical protein